MESTTRILRSEALAALFAGVVIWWTNGGSLLWFIPLLLTPDISMLGYLAGSRIGAFTYNVVHNWTLAIALVGVGSWIDNMPILLAGALLLAHVGMDRALGYGLKLPSDSRDTHLGRIGAKA